MMASPMYSKDGITLHCADCREMLSTLADSSIDLIVTDPPYFKVKGEEWDWQWDKPAEFLGWIGSLCDEWQRVLKPNGSLYVFASPQMAWGVEGEVKRRFNVLNNIRWVKDAGWHNKTDEETLRGYLNPWESIIFAEHFGADNIAKGEAGYVAKCDELRGFVFEPLRAYLASERDRAGWTTRRVAEQFQKKTGSRTVTGMAGHWFEQVQWTLPTEENYLWLRELFNNGSGGEYLRKDYEDLRKDYEYLRRDYDELRQEYEDLRRPFNVSANVPYTDVWDYPTVQAYDGKHPCEKPLRMMEDIIRASSRPGAMVLDCFAGSGVVGEAARNLGRQAILCEVDASWCRRIKEGLRQGVLSFSENA